MRGFHFQDGDARLHIGRLDVHSEPPRKTCAQPLFEGREVLRGAVGSDDDLLVRLIKVVEDVEERFLHGILAAEELDVVDHEHVARAVLLSEAVAVLVVAATDDPDELVDHGLGVGVDHFCLGRVFEQEVADGVQKVSLPETDAAVDEERVIFPARVLRNGLCGGESELIGFSLHKSVEGIFLHERVGFPFLFRVLLIHDEPAVREGYALFFEIFPLLLFYDDLHIRDEGIEGRRDLSDLVEITSLNGLF